MMHPSVVSCPTCGTATSARYCPVCGFCSEVGKATYLHTKGGKQVPLLGVALAAEVYGSHARVVLRQRYRNLETKPIEALYTFPIPSDATLVGFAMECEGRRLEAEVKEREEAFAAYDDAINKGHGAALLEQERANVFTASVGNLLPNEETIVEVVFLQKLTADEGALRLMIPTLVAPRYIPGVPTGDRTASGEAQPTDLVPDADRITPRIGDAKYGLTLDVLFDLGRDVTIESPSHTVVVTDAGGQRKRVAFRSGEVALDRDLVLVAEGAPGVAAGLVCDKRTGEEGTFALTLVPDLFEAKKTASSRSLVFVVDVSGSMAGASIEQAKRALHLCLRHLSEGDVFDIVPFSSSFDHFSRTASKRGRGVAELVPFTQSTLSQADEYVEALRADGGTEMLGPLAAALRLLADKNHDRVVVLLTDGQVGNEAQILDRISSEAAGARVYGIGIGTNVSDLLLGGLAKKTRGAVEFIHPGERIDEKVTAQFARATAARVENLAIAWVGADASEVAPTDPPALVDGEPWSVYGRYDSPGKGRLELRGTLGGDDFFLEVPIDFPASADRPALTSLWAGARVRDLEEVDQRTLGRRAALHKKRIVDLCVRYRIASKYASFIVIETRSGDRRAKGMPETRAIPVSAPAGWAMFTRPEVEDQRLFVGGCRLPGPAATAGLPPACGAVSDSSPDAPPRASSSALFDRVNNVSTAVPRPKGLLGRALGALGLSKRDAPHAEFSDLSTDALRPAPRRRHVGSSDLGALFARQLASGLWEELDSSDAGRIAATAACLERCAGEGVSSTDTVYGAQINKAVDALLVIVAPLAKEGKQDDLVLRALRSILAVSTGKRTRKRVLTLAQTAKSSAVRQLAP